jgi:hypothetical protein
MADQEAKPVIDIGNTLVFCGHLQRNKDSIFPGAICLRTAAKLAGKCGQPDTAKDVDENFAFPCCRVALVQSLRVLRDSKPQIEGPVSIEPSQAGAKVRIVLGPNFVETERGLVSIDN